MKELRKRLWREVALCASFLQLIHSNVAYSVDPKDTLSTIAKASVGDGSVVETTYTINFNNVSIIELIRFASKITNLNFIFEEGDLQFTVTLVSEEPISAKNMMAALAQVLRVHNLALLEQENNVLIVKSGTVNQIPTIISSDLPDSQAGNSVLVTRVFRIKNASLGSIATIVRPLTSKDALIEISNETRQLIITDLTTNVEKIASLLESIDAPHSPLDIETFIVKHISPQELITLTQQILTPFTEGNPLIFVPQIETNSIFIVSTPYLIDRAIAVMEDLDMPIKPGVVGVGKSAFIYKTVNRSAPDLLAILHEVGKELRASLEQKTTVELAINDAQVIKDTNTILFVADPATITALRGILDSLDTPIVGGKEGFYIYKIANASEEQISRSLKQIATQLTDTPAPDKDLIRAIKSLHWIKETNALIFTGTAPALASLKTLIPTFDVSVSTAKTMLAASKSNFLIYTPQFQTGEELESLIHEVADNLKSSGLANPTLIATFDSMRWIPSNNALIFTGDPQSLERVQAILKSMDSPSPYLTKSTQIFIYKPQYASSGQIQAAFHRMLSSLDRMSVADQNLTQAIKTMEWDTDTQSFIISSDPATISRMKELLSSLDTAQEISGKSAQGFFLYKLQSAQGEVVIEELKRIATQIPQSNIQNQNVVAAIDKIQWVPSTNSLLITGSDDAITRVKQLIAEFDLPTIGKSSFFIFKPQHKSPEQLEADLQTTIHDLQDAGLIDPELFDSLSSMKYISATNSFVFTGAPATLDRVKEVLAMVDTGISGSHIQRIGKVTFLVYKLEYVSGDQLMSSLKSFSHQLQNSPIEDKSLSKTIDDMRYIKETNSMLFIGPAEVLDKINELVKQFDVSSLAAAPEAPPPARPEATYTLYTPVNIRGLDLISILHDFKSNLQNSGVSDPNLFDAIDNMKWIDKTSTLLISGDKAAVAKVQELLQRFDIPGKESSPIPTIEAIDNMSFLVYKLQYHQGSEIRDALKQVGHSLVKSGKITQTNLMEAINSLQWIQVTNSLLGTGDQEVLIKLKELIQNLDIPLRQVFIEVLFIETSLSDFQNFGLMWGSQVQYMNKTILSTGNFPIPGSVGGSSSVTPSGAFSNLLHGINATTTPTGGAGGVPFTTGFDLGVIGDIIMHKGKSFISLGSLVNALQQDSMSTILLNPKIIAQDNQQANVFVGQNIPYTGAVVNTLGASQQTTGNIEYRDVGVSLTITPILGDNDIVTLDIVADISEQITNPTGGATIGGTQLTGITTSHNHMETRIQVPDRLFVALSGMINDSKTHYRTAIPCLGGLPVVGALFSENDRTASKTNVIIFLKPYIISSYDEYKQITEHQEWIYKNNAVLPVLKEEFDAALDLVKTPEDEK